MIAAIHKLEEAEKYRKQDMVNNFTNKPGISIHNLQKMNYMVGGQSLRPHIGGHSIDPAQRCSDFLSIVFHVF